VIAEDEYERNTIKNSTITAANSFSAKKLMQIINEITKLLKFGKLCSFLKMLSLFGLKCQYYICQEKIIPIRLISHKPAKTKLEFVELQESYRQNLK